MIILEYPKNYLQWRDEALALIQHHVPPHQVSWSSSKQQSIFLNNLPHLDPSKSIAVPKDFVGIAKTLTCYRHQDQWNILYRVLFSLCFQNKNLLNIKSDQDVFTLHTMIKSIQRDCHKMKAFVRFRAVPDLQNSYLAWYEPDHFIVEKTAYFFKQRFANMHWGILTPDASVFWDTKNLVFKNGAQKNMSVQSDSMENLWDAFYQSIFNPNRLKVNMMKSEMPVRFWKNLPEAKNIGHLIQSAHLQSEKMIHNKKSRP